MPVNLLRTRDTEQTLHFPLGGINVVSAFGKQPNVPVDQSIGWYARTTPSAFNVRVYDQGASRARGGSRPGLSRYISKRLPGSIMNVNAIVGVGYADPGGGPVQSSSSGRLVTGVVVANGNIRIWGAGADDYVTPTNGTGALNPTGLVFSAVNDAKMFFADGAHSVYYSPADNTVHPWVATDGTLPVDGDGNLPRLIWTWAGRTGLSGLIKDPQNWFLSALGDPFNYNYNPFPSNATQAIAGNNSTIGKIGDVITCPIPFNDDVMIFGCDHSIWAMQGNPTDGGRLIRVSDAIGLAWGAPWCSDPYGNVYFFSNRCGIYKMDPTQARPTPVRISQQIEPLLATVNTGANTISMAWDDRWQGFHVFVTRTAGPYRAVHLFYESRTNAWFTDRFANRMHNPLCCCSFDGNTTEDRVVLIGSWDGFIRFLNPAATKDDGVPIESSVVIGPILTNTADEILQTEMQPIFAEMGGDVRYDIFTGKTAEAALASASSLSGTFVTGRNHTVPIMRRGNAIYQKFSATTPWAMEACRIAVRGLGPVLRRN